MSQPGTTGPEDDYTQHYAAENGSTSANGTKYLEKERGCKFDFFAQGSVSREPIKAGDKSPLSSATRKFELKICMFFSFDKEERWSCFVVDIMIPTQGTTGIVVMHR